MSKTLAIFVTYYPDVDLFRHNLEQIKPYVEGIVVCENTPENESSRYRITDFPDIVYLCSGENSISKGLNLAVKYAVENGYDYMVTMDQDSVFVDFNSYKTRAIHYLETHWAIIGPTPNAKALKDEYRRSRDSVIITSGMFMKVSTISYLNGYCEDFAIEGIDGELCAKAFREGIEVVQDKKSSLIQKYGDFRKITITKNKSIAIFNYKPNRLFYIFRNHIMIYRKYKDVSFTKQLMAKYYIRYIPKILLFEKNKINKISAIIRGTYHGIFD